MVSMVHAVRAQVAHDLENLVVGLTQAHHQARLGREVRMARLEMREELERVRIVATRPRLPVKPGHGLEIVVHHVRERRVQRLERALQAPSEIRHEDLDFRPGRALPHPRGCSRRVTRAAVLQSRRDPRS